MKDRVADLLRDGRAAARIGQRARARRKFRAVLIFDPTNVAALLWMAWLSDDPRVSLAYVASALARDPHNPCTHAALHWARRRATSPALPKQPSPPVPAAPLPHHRWKRPVATVVLGLLVILIGSALAWCLPVDPPVLAALVPTSYSTATVTASPVPSCTPTPESTLTQTPMPTTTATSLPTEIPVSTHTATVVLPPVLPTTPPPPPTVTPALPPPHSEERWIDVDLTRQVLTAYVGQMVVHMTPVSTGLPRTPTPVGQYRIQIKLRYDDMSGPGYYLPDVPYVMYFHRGYGLHGTYWHNNFGHPMSHGCVNLPTPEAEWFFAWAEVGTLVNIHY